MECHQRRNNEQSRPFAPYALGLERQKRRRAWTRLESKADWLALCVSGQSPRFLPCPCEPRGGRGRPFGGALLIQTRPHVVAALRARRPWRHRRARPLRQESHAPTENWISQAGAMCVVRMTRDGDGADGALEKKNHVLCVCSHVSIRPIVRRCVWVCVCAFTCVCVHMRLGVHMRGGHARAPRGAFGGQSMAQSWQNMIQSARLDRDS